MSQAARIAGEAWHEGDDTWLSPFSTEPVMSIGQVVDVLKGEFQSISPSKIRFLESEELIAPSRTGSGYRKFSDADVERIRYILREQRDYFTPLKIIHDQLRALDAGHEVERRRPARVVAAEGKVVAPSDSRAIPLRELLDLTGVSEDEVSEMVRVGMLTPDTAGYFPSRSIQVVVLLHRLSAMGLEPRNLRAVRSAAERCVDVIDTAVSSRRSRNRPGDAERAAVRAAELAEILSDLQRELVRSTVDRLNDGL